MIRYEDAYKSEFSEQLKRNVIELQNTMTITPDIMKSLNTWGLNHSLPLGLIKYSFYTNENFKFQFLKDPKRQSVASKAFLHFIQNIYGDDSIIELPIKSKGCLHCINGMVIPQTVSKNVDKDSKSIDFKIVDAAKRNIYIYHKRTSAKGGVQDNQSKDVELFLKEAGSSNDRNNVFVAVVDGEYYVKKIQSFKDKYEKEGRVYVYNSDTFVEEFLSKCMNVEQNERKELI